MTARLSMVAASSLLVASALAQEAPARPPAAEVLPEAIPIVREGATAKLAEHTYAIIDDTVGNPNIGIVVGSRATLVINAGLGRRNGEAVLREVAKVSNNRDVYLAFTHEHPIGVVGHVAFPEAAKIVMPRIQAAEFSRYGMEMTRWLMTRSPAWADLLKDAAPPQADIVFDREHLLDLGGVRVRFVVVGPAHTPGDTLFFVDEDKVLFGGDVIENATFLNAGPASSMKAWLAAFDLADAMRPQRVVPAHGQVEDASLIDVNRRMMQAIQARVGELKAQGQPVDRIAATVRKEMEAKYPSWDSGDRVAGAARAAHREAP